MRTSDLVQGNVDTRLREGEVIAERYELVRPLAAGGMGSVWVARHLQLGVEVAVKFMDPTFISSAPLRARFEREAKAAAMLKTAHVVQVLDHGVDGQTPYIAMELLAGEDLRTRLRRCRRLSLTTTAGLLAQVAKAIRAAHGAGIVHRDLKPANIFLALVDDDEIVKVLDFGVAKFFHETDDREATRTGVSVGSPSYMSPEQARSARGIDHRADLWSLAVVLFRCVVGRPAFVGETANDIIVKICTEPVPIPSHLAPDLPPSIDHFFARALARNPDQRFDTIDDLTAAFDAAVAGISTAEVPPGPTATLGTTGPSMPSFGSRPLHDPIAAAGTPNVPAEAPATLLLVGAQPGTLTGAGALSGPGALGQRRPWAARAGATVAAFAILLGLGIWWAAARGSETSPSEQADPADPSGSESAWPAAEDGASARSADPGADRTGASAPSADAAPAAPDSAVPVPPTAASAASTARPSSRPTAPPPAKLKSTTGPPQPQRPVWGF